jgi:hypothetical protein
VTNAVKKTYRAGRAALARVIARALPAKIMRDKRYFATWERYGYHVTPVHYYSAVPDIAALEETLWSEARLPVGIDMREGAQLELLETVSTRYGSEFSRFPREAPTADCPFFVNNGNFFGVDAEMLYGMVRKQRPRRITEIGSGFSMLLVPWQSRRTRRKILFTNASLSPSSHFQKANYFRGARTCPS